MKIATWNVNSIRARLDTVTRWIGEAQPDIACLQEIKTTDEGFPAKVFQDLGYNVAVHGQKSYNGVAILSKLPFDEVRPGLPGDDDDNQARYLEAVVSTGGRAVRVASIYAPNGNPIGSEKFSYKLAWLERLKKHACDLFRLEEPVVLAGDYNVIPTDVDVRNPAGWLNDALFQPESRARFRELVYSGLTDAFRACSGDPGHYTFWDYQAGAWQKNNGIRIDHLLLTPQAADILAACRIERDVRGWDRPSDHVPVWAELAV